MNTRKITILSIILIMALSLSACNLNLFQSEAATATQAPVQTEAATQETTQAAQITTNLGGLSDYEDTLVSIYEKVNPSVVNIQVTEKVKTSTSTSPEDLFSNIPGFQFFFGSPTTPNEQQQSEQVTQALGSGFVWNKEGYIVTNNHVVEGADTIKVKFYDGTTADASIVGTDVNSDLAVIKLENYSGQLSPITTSDSDSVKVGQVAVAIGNPYGLENTMTVGIISALGRSLPTEISSSTGGQFTIPDIIQTDAPINPGNSGGVLVDDQGALVGVTSAIESSSGSNAGIGFAVPSNIVNKVVPELIASGKYDHAFLGLTGTTLTSDMASEMNVNPDQRGILVIDVTKGGPADEAGIKGGTNAVTINGQQLNVGGDIITAIDGEPLTTMDDLISYLSRSTEVGQTVELSGLRDGKEITFKAALTARPNGNEEESTQIVQTDETPSSSGWLGISSITLNSDIAKEMGLSADQQGALVQEIQSGSPADEAGMIGSYKPVLINMKRVLIGGDIITALDKQAISSADDLKQSLTDTTPGQKIQLTILRGGETKNLTITLAEKPVN